jgi:predicted N-acyltransferase
VRASTISTLAELDPSELARLVDGDHPFVDPAFLAGLETTRCLRPELGWRPRHLTLVDEGRIVALAPAYEKRNSHGEFVFDHAWADAHHQLGIAYYPKLLCAVPYTPVTGPRLLVARGATDPDALRRRLLEALAEDAARAGWSSAHVNFVTEAELAAGRALGWIERSDVQYHWRNAGYRDFDDFLAALRHKRRKEIRRERARVAADGWRFECRPGHELDRGTIAILHGLYVQTFIDKGNVPALTRAFFEHLAGTLGPRLLAILGFRAGRLGAMALCLRSRDTLYGRYWGTDDPSPALHFETCYYQGLEYCIRERLARFEPGAQGEHKIARGFLPARTHSLHWIAHPELRRAIAAACERERRWLDDYQAAAARASPFAERPSHADPVAAG